MLQFVNLASFHTTEIMLMFLYFSFVTVLPTRKKKKYGRTLLDCSERTQYETQPDQDDTVHQRVQ